MSPLLAIIVSLQIKHGVNHLTQYSKGGFLEMKLINKSSSDVEDEKK